MVSEKVTVVLKTADDWDEWVEIIKSAAIGLEVWDLINPSKATVDRMRGRRDNDLATSRREQQVSPA